MKIMNVEIKLIRTSQVLDLANYLLMHKVNGNIKFHGLNAKKMD